jgi:sugar fermentation stimulation protein A
MRFSFSTEPTTFLDRPNRFLINVRLHHDGAIIRAHCPNPGRLRELLRSGAVVHVSRVQEKARKTSYTLRFVEHPDNGQLISLDTQLPNSVFREGVEAGWLQAFSGYPSIQPEVWLTEMGGNPVRSRIDFFLQGEDRVACWVEVKSVTLVENRHALFPDAPTIRGARHVEELRHVVQRKGVRAAVVFIVQRPDADCFSPHWDTDPVFGRALAIARQTGVELFAYTCSLSKTEIMLEREIPVII